MHTETKRKIEYLQKYITKNLSRWYKKYGKNVTGVRVDRKRRRNDAKNYYAIVFNVIKKIKEADLLKKEIIPKYFNIHDVNGKNIKIRTDVRQTGEFNFHSQIMDEVREGRNGNAGTLGLLLTDQSQNVFGLTSFHVAAQSLLRRQIYSYDVNRGDQMHDVLVSGEICTLYSGTFNSHLDAALVYLGSNLNYSNELPDGGGLVNNLRFIDEHLLLNSRGKNVSLYLPSQGGRIDMNIEDNQAPLNYGHFEFFGLITVNRCSEGGDSGSLVLGIKNMVLGIVLGGDDFYTYIIPYFKIYNFFNLKII